MNIERSSGILLHLTSLPGPHGSGDLGPSAYHFVDWLVLAGQRYWQMLPFTPTGYGNSPYSSISSFAGNPLFVALEEFKERGLLTDADFADLPQFSSDKVVYPAVTEFRMRLLRKAAAKFFDNGSALEHREFDLYCKQQAAWLDDYALFASLNDSHNGKEWSVWEEPLKSRKPKVLKEAAAELALEVRFHKFIQWNFERQWHQLKEYANAKGVKLIGDIPIFVAYHSSDVWANQHLYHLGDDHRPTVVAGVPPDYFSKTGQRWGNPLYHWKKHQHENFHWWIQRLRRTLSFVDVLRIDHFRGFAAYWEIPASEKTAVRGRWIGGPRERLFKAIEKELGPLPIIAEDLGVITPDVVVLRDSLGFPGMKILQFAFASDPENGFLPHNYTKNSVVYTGTHDNDTTRGWYANATERERTFARKYLGYTDSDDASICRLLILEAERSVAALSILPFQDVLGLDSAGRFNFPGTVGGNWEWRFHWEMVRPTAADELYEVTALCGRCEPSRLTLPAYPADRQIP